MVRFTLASLLFLTLSLAGAQAWTQPQPEQPMQTPSSTVAQPWMQPQVPPEQPMPMPSTNMAQAWSQPRIEVQPGSSGLSTPTRISADGGMTLGSARLSDFVFRTSAAEPYLVREGAGSTDYVGEDMSFRDYTVSGTASVYFRHYNVNPEARLASVELDPPLTQEHLVLLVAPESHLQLVSNLEQGEDVTTGRFVICSGLMNGYVMDATAFPGRDWSIVNVYSPLAWSLTHSSETIPQCQ